ncbi:MAG: hypothetical protein LBR55_05825 [Bacteroidales bacterium]|jgi:hypothetical protein|nr:hypothetical protein [Bacteroidales bacterium]
MDNKIEQEQKKETAKNSDKKLPKCGIVMPISAIDTCSAEHWSEVLNIIKDAVGQAGAGFEPNLVSDSDESGIIQKRIIHNLYSNEIVVCDVSAKNPNVMFELGIRLAFDKPTIIIKDDKTDYSFDTSVIEHLTYPRDLRFSKIVVFKDALKKKVQDTYEKATKDTNYTTFLKHFGEYKVAQLSEKEVTSEKYILSALDELRYEMMMIRRNQQTQQIEINDSNRNYSMNGRRQRQVVSRNIDNFMKENQIETREQIYMMDRESELFDYLINVGEVRAVCGSPEIIRELMMSIISPK